MQLLAHLQGVAHPDRWRLGLGSGSWDLSTLHCATPIENLPDPIASLAALHPSLACGEFAAMIFVPSFRRQRRAGPNCRPDGGATLH
ncbi:MAG: hypothetical protein A3H27_11525 [Acidobacteria bacterium RIFCSPLOWO2_02_FULL_59_13]|nr:MAG: hypothetical protein A3H27_11525 [Acidobacteria bacterium RIFCSPLOWO2_02_FULL_59_13]